MYDQLVAYLSLHDIHLLISTLECLYSLSCLGATPCNSIARTHGAIDALVSLMTVEAQSYGPKACILMRVVETVPGALAGTQQVRLTIKYSIVVKSRSHCLESILSTFVNHFREVQPNTNNKLRWCPRQPPVFLRVIFTPQRQPFDLSRVKLPLFNNPSPTLSNSHKFSIKCSLKRNKQLSVGRSFRCSEHRMQ